tara:strand:+ start:15909 stop:17147 length:1239 start_codon:yes stop_codon:yes gene_type:complete
MVKIGSINEYICIDLNDYSYNIIENYLENLDNLKTEEFIPKFSYVKIEKIIIIRDKCKILDYNNISNYDIHDINLIIETINKHSIDIIYLENIPFFKNINNNKIYFINFLWTNNTNKINKNRTLLFNTKYSNKYLLKNFLQKHSEKNLNIFKNINLYFYIHFTDFNQIIQKLYYFINNITKLDLFNIRYILCVNQINYDKLLKIINKDLFNKFYIINTEIIDNFNETCLNLLYLFNLNKLDIDFLYLYDLDKNDYNYDFLEKSIKLIYEKKLENIIITMNKLNNIILDDLNKFLINNEINNNIIRNKKKCITRYSIDDINYDNIYYNNILLGKNSFLKFYKNKDFNINYNFIDRLYPKNMNFNNMLIDKACLNIINSEFNKIKNFYNMDNTENLVLLSLILFYNSTSIQQIN